MTQAKATPAPKTNVFTGVPPLIPMVVLGIVLVSMAQFPSTEKLAAAFAWLIFVAVLMADGIDAFNNITHLVNSGTPKTNSPTATSSGNSGPARPT